MLNFVMYLWVKKRITDDQIGQLVDNGRLTQAQAALILDYPQED